MVDFISTQDLINVKQDIEDIGLSVNTDGVITPRYGSAYDSLPKVIREMIEQKNLKLAELQAAIDTAVAAGVGTAGWYSYLVVHDNGETQKQINDYIGATWYARVSGYGVNDKARLSTGEVVVSTIANNTNNPNSNMTGWVKYNSASQIFDESGQTQQQINADIGNKIARYPTILDFFTQSELATFNSNPTMDCTAIIKRAFATGAKRINFLDLKLHVSLNTDGTESLGTFSSGDIELIANGATIIDDTTHTNNGAIVAMFTLSNGVKSFKSNLNYEGKSIDVATEIGYKGGTYVYSKGKNKNIEVNARLKNIRYGILAGNYSDPSLGGHKGIRGNLQCDTVGYPIASYLADDIEITITGDTFHRVSYIAGCDYARVTALTKNYYIASVACLFSDAKTGDGTSKGCTDCKVHVVDQGSTAYVANSWLCGISLSRVDPNTAYDNMEFYAEVRGVGSTVANTLGAFIVNSTVKNIISGYSSNWIPEIKLNNIRFNALIDRSAQTGNEHSIGDIYVHTEDNAANNEVGTTSQFHFDNIEYKKGTGSNTRTAYILLRGLVGKAFFNNVNVPDNAVFMYGSNGTSKTYFDKCKIRGLSSSASDLTPNTTCVFNLCDIYGGTSYILQTNKTFIDTTIGSLATPRIKTSANEITLTGSSVTWTNALPANSLILSISFVITETITGTSGVMVGIPTATTKFYNVLATSVGSGASVSSSVASSFPYITAGTTNLLITARDAATFTGGKVKVVVNYIEFPVPTI